MFDFDKVTFDENLPNYGDIFPLDEWKKMVINGECTSYDGNGNWVKDGKISSNGNSLIVNEIAIDDAIEYGVTGVCWFNA